jgi:hypothetical protein
MLVLFSATLSGLSACGGGGGGGGGSNPPGGNNTPRATVTLSISAPSARVGDTVTLEWASTNAASCTASGSWSGGRTTSGSETITVSEVGAATYLLTCSGAGGAGEASASLNALAAVRQVNVPGAPAPVALADGECAPTTTAEFTITCPSVDEIDSVYESFLGDLSGRVTLASLDATPVVTTGGTCSAGFDRSASQFVLDTSFRNELISTTGAIVTEIVYSSEFLESLGLQGTISEMSVVLFQDNSNSERVGMVMYIDGSSGPLTYAVAGNISDEENGGFDLITCFSSDDEVPPPPTGLECPAGFGEGREGLEFLPGQNLSYEVSPGTANAPTQGTMTWGVRFNNPELDATSYTGSLRVSLWALETTFPGSGQFTGYQLLQASPNFAGEGARSATQLYNFYSVSDIVSSANGANPPPGEYCIVMLLEMFDDQECDTDDNYCYADWLQFEGAETF